MIITTTPSIEGRPITGYKGIVVGEEFTGANVVAVEARPSVAFSFEGFVK